MLELDRNPICSNCGSNLRRECVQGVLVYYCDNCHYFVLLNDKYTLCEHCSSVMYVQPDFKSIVNKPAIADTKYLSVCSNSNCPNTKVEKIDKYSYIIKKKLDYDMLNLTYTNIDGIVLTTMAGSERNIILPDNSMVSKLILEILNDRK